MLHYIGHLSMGSRLDLMVQLPGVCRKLEHNTTPGVQVREALEAAKPDFSSSRKLCNTEYCVAQDLPAVPGINLKVVQLFTRPRRCVCAAKAALAQSLWHSTLASHLRPAMHNITRALHMVPE
jgi:hypothetical protein